MVDTLKKTLPEIKAKLSEPDIDLKLVMDQSVYVRASIGALVQEGIIGAVLCSLVILLFLGQWRMTLIAILTLPLSVLVGDRLPVHDRANDQRHDPGRADAGDRPDDRQRHHLPGEHASPPDAGRRPQAGRPGRRQRGGHAGAGLDAVHVPGADRRWS